MRKTILALAAGLLLAGCAEKAPERGALILGEATGFNPQDTVVATLFKFEGGFGRGLAKDTLQNGHYSFRLDSLKDGIDYYAVFFHCQSGDQRNVTLGYGPELYLEPGVVVRIQGEGRYYRLARVDSPVKDQKLRENYMRKLSAEDWMAIDDIEAGRQQAFHELDTRTDLSPEQVDSLRAVTRRGMKAMREIGDRLDLEELKLLETEEIGAYAIDQLRFLAREMADGKKEYRESIVRAYGRLTEEQKASPAGVEIRNYLEPVETVSFGDPAPDYGYVDKEGKTVRISDFRGKWVLMDFWRFGCGPCIKAVPELGALSRELQDKLVVVSISVDKEPIWKKASEEHGITWNDWNDPKGFSGGIRTYGAPGVPAFVLVTPEGAIDYIMVGYATGKLRELMKSAKLII